MDNRRPLVAPDVKYVSLNYDDPDLKRVEGAGDTVRYFDLLELLDRVVGRSGPQWKDAPPGYGSHKTLYDRFIRWSRFGMFTRIFAALAAGAGVPDRLMIDSTHLKVHQTAASLLKEGCFKLHRTDQRRPELQAARRLQGCCSLAACAPRSG